MRGRDLVILGVPSSAGAFAAGQERAPAALREAGLVERLAAGGEVLDLGDLPGFGWRPDREQPRAQPAGRVVGAAGQVGGEGAEGSGTGSSREPSTRGGWWRQRGRCATRLRTGSRPAAGCWCWAATAR